MLNDENINLPASYPKISEANERIKFTMPSDLKTGSLLRTLVASKPGGRFLDIGTGTGLSLSWIAEGAGSSASIVSIDNEASYQQIARAVYDTDERITLICEDANEWLLSYQDEQFDLIFADAWPGKYEKLDETLALIKIGGYYLIDDLLAQPNWPEGHQDNVNKLIETLKNKNEFVYTILNWSTGLILFTRIK